MSHPFHFEEVTVEFEGETLNGKPHGLCFLNYSTDEDEDDHFRGLGMMKEGKLHGGPACFALKNGDALSTSYMQDGRQKGYQIMYNAVGSTENVVSPTEQTDVSGWAYYIGEAKDG